MASEPGPCRAVGGAGEEGLVAGVAVGRVVMLGQRGKPLVAGARAAAHAARRGSAVDPQDGDAPVAARSGTERDSHQPTSSSNPTPATLAPQAPTAPAN